MRTERDLAAVCCHFNPFRSRQRTGNYRRFRRLIAHAGVCVLTVELAFGEDPFELEDGRDVIRLRGGDIMWQKERLMQIGAERLVGEGYRKIAFLDADVIFQSREWPALVSRSLERHHVVQCFSRAIRNYGDAVSFQPSAVKNFLELGASPGRAKGIAWAMTAEAFEKAGLYQHCVVGGGDSALCCAALGLASDDDAWERHLKHQKFLRFAGTAMRSHYMQWANRFYRAVGRTCGYIEQGVFTLSHGWHKSREYGRRHRLLDDFDPVGELTTDKAGAFVWTESGRARSGPVREYLLSRKD